MIPAEFKRKWARYSGKETAAYQEHFNDLCALLTDEQILERLLALNQQRSADEKPATRKQPRGSRARTGDEFV